MAVSLLLSQIARTRISETADHAGSWASTRRPEQVPPAGEWSVWCLRTGRGWGKTRTGTETVDGWAREAPGIRIHLVARTAADVRDTMVQGDSGIVTRHPDVRWEPSKRLLTWPGGSTALTFSADEPDQLRGPQCHRAWADEVASWRFPSAWDMLLLGLRLGSSTRVVVTTTPRPTSLMRGILAMPGVVEVRGRTEDNAANLAPDYLARIRALYGGTRLGRQELDGELLDDCPGALWRRADIDRARVSVAPVLRRVVVAIDPAVTATEASDETGIVVAGLGADGHGYVLDDRSGRYSPDGWAKLAVKLYHRYEADRIVAEVNQGGDMVGATLRTVAPGVPYLALHASRGKRVRAEPIAALYEQGKIHHVGTLPELEDQLCSWDAQDGSASPDRLDALVWALTELIKPCVPAAYGALQPLRSGLPRRRI